MTTKNPKVGVIVDYYNPGLILRVGRIDGYGGRGIGPYAAIVTNDLGNGVTLSVFLPDLDHPIEQKAIVHKDDLPDGTTDKPYWDWPVADVADWETLAPDLPATASVTPAPAKATTKVK